MVKPGAGGSYRLVVVAAVCVVLGAADARRRPVDDAVDSPAGYALLSSARIKVGRAASIEGHVHSNDSIDLRRDSTVRGDVSAVGEVKNRGGIVLGHVLERAAAVALPVAPDKNQARTEADRVLTGPVELISPTIDDVVFVTGAVTIVGEARGTGSLIATGDITVTAPVGASGPPQSSFAPRLSVLTYADLSLASSSLLRARVRAHGRALLGEQSVLDGSLVAEREVELARGARAVFEPPGDTTAPTITILGPAEPFIAAQPTLDLTVLYADAVPGPDASSFSLLLDGAVVTDRCSIGAGVAFCTVGLSSSGPHLLMAAIRDLAGNAGAQSLPFTAVIDAQPPAIAIEAPAEGALLAEEEATLRGAVTDDGAIASVLVNDVAVQAPGGRFVHTVRLEEGGNVVRVSARDTTGKQSEAALDLVLDTVPPRLTMLSPVGLAIAQQAGDTPLTLTTHLPSIVVRGAAEDEHGIESVVVAGAPVAHTAGDFERQVALEEGVNGVRITALDGAGNAAAVELAIARSTAPSVSIVAPVDGAILRDHSVGVHGTVAPAAAEVVVNGRIATVTGTEWTLDDLPIGDGATLINVVATAASGLLGTAGVTVLRDVDAPIVSIADPADGAVVYDPEVSVIGMVNDVVVGTVNGAQVSLTVNGAVAQVSNRSFLLDRLPLREGDNAIEAVAVDPSGNVGRHSIVVRRVHRTGPVLSVFSGDHQTAAIGETLPASLVVGLRDPAGLPVPGRVVTFVADGTDGRFGEGRRQVAIATDGQGRASVRLTLGRRAGHHSVRATATGIDGEALFVSRALAAEPAVLVVDSGDQQVGAVGEPLRAPFAAVVTDDGFNRLEGAVVRFEVIGGGGTLENGERETDLVTDSDGRVTARLTLGLEEGVGNNVVQARLVDGPPEAQVTFAASALVPTDPASTSVSGVVLDNTDQPVPGATVTLEGTTLSTRTDATGFFRLTGAPPGTAHLRVRGSTAERAGPWPSLEFLITLISGRDNAMGRPIFLPQLDVANALAVDEDTGGVLTIRDLPGFALEVEPGSVTFPGGSRSGVLTVTPVHSDKVPMPPNFGQQPRFVITIQPGGAHFAPPARVTFPNVDGLAPGAVTELYSFDHDLARFVNIGPGTVTGDGTRIVSGPGGGIAKSSWSGAGDPARPGSCHDCGECKRASGGACVADDSLTPSQAAPDDCLRQSCSGGTVVDSMTNQESAMQVEDNCKDELCPRPNFAVELDDAPPGLKCCGDEAYPLPGAMSRGLLTGIYDPDQRCCVENGHRLISRRAPIDFDDCPEKEPARRPPEHTYNGCSVPLSAEILARLNGGGLPFGSRNEPTPPGHVGDAAFSAEGSVGGEPVLPCDRHDQCYEECNGDRGMCDEDFLSDMNTVCGGVTGTYLEPVPELPGVVRERDRRALCVEWAGIYAAAVSAGAELAWRADQERHCDCVCS